MSSLLSESPTTVRAAENLETDLTGHRVFRGYGYHAAEEKASGPARTLLVYTAEAP